MQVNFVTYLASVNLFQTQVIRAAEFIRDHHKYLFLDNVPCKIVLHRNAIYLRQTFHNHSQFWKFPIGRALPVESQILLQWAINHLWNQLWPCTFEVWSGVVCSCFCGTVFKRTNSLLICQTLSRLGVFLNQCEFATMCECDQCEFATSVPCPQ